MALQRAEMRMVRWMCGVKLKDRLPSKELRERLGIDDIALVLQQRAWREVVREDCQARKMNKEDAIDRCKWRKMIKDVQ